MLHRKCFAPIALAAIFFSAAPLPAAEPLKLPADSQPAGPFIFWPPAPDAPRIQFLAAISAPSDVTGPTTQPDFKNDFLARPYGIRIAEGRLHVCDATASSNVTILDLRQHEVHTLGATGQARLSKPIDVAIASDGTRYVADSGHNAVLVFDAEDKYAGKIAVDKMRPVSVAVLKDELFVSDLSASRVRVFNRLTAKELRTIGEPGNKDGQLGAAMGLVIDKDFNIHVNDVLGCKVQKFSLNGKFVSSLGGVGDKPGQFTRPKFMAADSDGILYVVDNAFQNVQMFSAKGEFLMHFGGGDDTPGSMNAPNGICISEDPKDIALYARFVDPAFDVQRLVFVSNMIGPAKINIYGFGQRKAAKAP
jgi:hypothetical protein